MTESIEKGYNSRLGIWLFIASEAMLFGGLFLLYSMYRLKNPADFHSASLELSRVFGTVNTCILITSSLFIALSLYMLKVGKERSSMLFLFLTIGLALIFLIIKAFEWAGKFQHGLYPNAEVLLGRPKGEILYFGLYFMMTGLHALHVIAGIGLLVFVFSRIRSGRISSMNPALLVNSALYWHLVDIIWIFLFPLFYLIT
jgi:cytochrome c oxidase subunit III